MEQIVANAMELIHTRNMLTKNITTDTSDYFLKYHFRFQTTRNTYQIIYKSGKFYVALFLRVTFFVQIIYKKLYKL